MLARARLEPGDSTKAAQHLEFARRDPAVRSEVHALLERLKTGDKARQSESAACRSKKLPEQ
jgi:hypothetical protein